MVGWPTGAKEGSRVVCDYDHGLVSVSGSDNTDGRWLTLTDAKNPKTGLSWRPRTLADALHRHGVVRTRCVLRVSLLRSSTAGGREYFACGEGLRGDSESRRPDWFK